MVIEIKEDLMETMIVTDSPRCFLPDGTEIVGEGFVFHSDRGRSYKLVDRPLFSVTTTLLVESSINNSPLKSCINEIYRF